MIIAVINGERNREATSMETYKQLIDKAGAEDKKIANKIEANFKKLGNLDKRFIGSNKPVLK